MARATTAEESEMRTFRRFLAPSNWEAMQRAPGLPSQRLEVAQALGNLFQRGG